MSNHDAADSLDALAQVLEALRATRSRLEKRRLLVDYLHAVPDEALPLAVTYLGGRLPTEATLAAPRRPPARRLTDRRPLGDVFIDGRADGAGSCPL